MYNYCQIETSVNFDQTIRRHVSEDNTFYNQRCENLKSKFQILLSFSLK